MVVSESALRKMMEKAYKGGGYHVATGNTPFGYCLMISNYGYAWCAVIKFEFVPWKVLGRIVSDIGEIPEEPGTAYLVNKDNPCFRWPQRLATQRQHGDRYAQPGL